ncbi:hypothetical protein [Pseudomonas sp. CGJS7]|uniref:hypothetical protein n=1 Tax=Pseudomonas sp. CGJS7 TaxID=3109348 RepID=UPI00300A9EBF
MERSSKKGGRVIPNAVGAWLAFYLQRTGGKMHRVTLVVLLLLFFLGAHAVEHKHEVVPEKNAEFKMPKSEEIKDLKRKALAGGKVEALRLAAWYMKFPEGSNSFEFWSLIAAENGSDVGQYNVAMLYLRKPDADIWGARARYWLGKAAKQGNVDAAREIARSKNESSR